MTFAAAFTELFSMGFQGFPGNEHSVSLGPARTRISRHFYWCDLKSIGTWCIVDLLEPADDSPIDPTTQQLVQEWNAEQVQRARNAIQDRDGLEGVMSICC
jgi:hypothetical protein